MQDWNTPDHTTADTEHGTLLFAGDVPLVIADWEVTENAPDCDGRVYASVRGWLVNGGGTGRLEDPYTEPIEAGRARLVFAELRGRQPLTDLDVHVDYHSVGKPYPNTWDHRGCQVTVSWMDRRIDADGKPIDEDEIGRTEWTNPATGQVFDLTDAYVPAGECYYDDPKHPAFTWQHFDRWSGGVPVLHVLRRPHHARPRGQAHHRRRVGPHRRRPEILRAHGRPHRRRLTSPAAAGVPPCRPGLIWPGRSRCSATTSTRTEGRGAVMPIRVFEVDVPIRHTTNRQLHGVHVFTGEASSTSEALCRAHEAYDAALAAQAAGLANPGKQAGGWGARGLRPDWALDWPAAKVGLWHNPYR